MLTIPTNPSAAGAVDREPTQAELNTATKDVVGHIICVSGHGVGKVVEFLNNGGFGVKSAHLIEFGDPFADGSSEFIISPLTAFLIAVLRSACGSRLFAVWPR